MKTEKYSECALAIPSFAETWKPSYVKERSWDKLFHIVSVAWEEKYESVVFTSKTSADVFFDIKEKDDCQEKRWEAYCEACREILFVQLRSGHSIDDLLKKYACMGVSNVKRFVEMWKSWKGDGVVSKTVYRG